MSTTSRGTASALNRNISTVRQDLTRRIVAIEESAGDRLNAMQQDALSILNHPSTTELRKDKLTLYDVLGDLQKLVTDGNLTPIIDIALTGAQSLSPEEKATIFQTLNVVGTSYELQSLESTVVSLVQRLRDIINPAEFCLEIPTRITHARTKGS